MNESNQYGELHDPETYQRVDMNPDEAEYWRQRASDSHDTKQDQAQHRLDEINARVVADHSEDYGG